MNFLRQGFRKLSSNR